MKLNITNPIYKQLVKLELIKKKNLLIINNKTRDSKVRVIKDKKSGIIFLEKNIIKKSHYTNKPHKDYLNKNNYKNFHEDDYRRIFQFKKYIINKSILDYGCGWGGFLKLASKYCHSVAGYETMNICQNYISKNIPKIKLISNKEKLKTKKYDLIFLFHVLEHMPDQINELKFLKSLLNKNGKIIIEVPTCNDILLSIKSLQSFRNFTFWSEHLILHNHQSLKKFLLSANFKKIKTFNYQRYNLDNHIKWFIDNLPNGNMKPLFKTSSHTKNNYQNFLYKNNRSDTIIAIASK
ncbi:class I SAM-dependent methyltransferase [Candidatus Pelagibacter communis]|uniref:class I SAM-dependent methyltransferase n=1 Tax=Candidatus Pelagibacter TaxID=198251 RepID=UPI003EDF35D0